MHVIDYWYWLYEVITAFAWLWSSINSDVMKWLLHMPINVINYHSISSQRIQVLFWCKCDCVSCSKCSCIIVINLHLVSVVEYRLCPSVTPYNFLSIAVVHVCFCFFRSNLDPSSSAECVNCWITSMFDFIYGVVYCLLQICFPYITMQLAAVVGHTVSFV